MGKQFWLLPDHRLAYLTHGVVADSKESLWEPTTVKATMILM
jgi:hypothetical protein